MTEKIFGGDLAGGPAFPSVTLAESVPNRETGVITHRHEGLHIGMSLRDYFAASSLTGMQVWDSVINGKNALFVGPGGCERVAEVAYQIADAMLKERAK